MKAIFVVIISFAFVLACCAQTDADVSLDEGLPKEGESNSDSLYEIHFSSGKICSVLQEELNQNLNTSGEVEYEESDLFLDWRHIRNENRTFLSAAEVDLNQDGHIETIVKKDFGGADKYFGFYGYETSPEGVLSLFEEYESIPLTITWQSFHNKYIEKTQEDYYERGIRSIYETYMEYPYEILSSVDPELIGPRTGARTLSYQIFIFEEKIYLAVDRIYLNARASMVVDEQYSLIEVADDNSLKQICLLTK